MRAVTRTSAKRGTSFAEEAAQADVLVTSYTIARLDEDELVDVDLSWLVLDEAQFIKNHASATYKAVRRLRAHVHSRERAVQRRKHCLLRQ